MSTLVDTSVGSVEGVSRGVEGVSVDTGVDGVERVSRMCRACVESVEPGLNARSLAMQHFGYTLVEPDEARQPTRASLEGRAGLFFCLGRDFLGPTAHRS